MAALTIERPTEFAGTMPRRGTYPLKSGVRLFKGGLTCLDSAGRAIPGTTKANGAVLAVGKSSSTIDNRLDGFDGKFDAEVEFGVFGWGSAGGGDAIGPQHVGGFAYVTDDQTVAATDGEGARIPAGIITEVRDGQVYVTMGPHVDAGDSARPALSLPDFNAGDSAPDNVIDGAVYGVPTTATNSTITLPAAADGTVIHVLADGTKNGHTLTFREGVTNISSATTASKRFAATAIRAGGKWAVDLGVGP